MFYHGLATSTPLSVKPHPNKPESHPQSSRHAPTVPDQQKPATSEVNSLKLNLFKWFPKLLNKNLTSF